MTLDTSAIGNSELITPEVPEETQKTPKLTRKQRIEQGKIVLTEKPGLSISTRLGIGVIMGRFQKIKNLHSWEHLQEEEKKYFKKTIDLDALPVDGFIEVWEQRPGHEEYHVTEYKKLK